MTYQAPLDDILSALKTAADLEGRLESGLYGDLDVDTLAAVIKEAGKFGAEVLEPLNRVGDKAGSKLVDGKVVTPEGVIRRDDPSARVLHVEENFRQRLE